MERVEKVFKIRLPAPTAYEQWVRYHEQTEITEHVPGQLIAWRSTTSGTPNTGRARFEPADGDATLLSIAVEYEPQSALEQSDAARGVVSRKIEAMFEGFEDFVSKHPTP